MTATTRTTTETTSKKARAKKVQDRIIEPAITAKSVATTSHTLMKVSCLQETLHDAIKLVLNAVSKKSTLAVLDNLLIATQDGMLKLAATDLEIGLTVTMNAKIEINGMTTVPAKLLADVVSKLRNEQIMLTLDTKDEATHLQCGQFNATLKGIEANQFPAIPTIEISQNAVAFPADLLRGALDEVSFAAATDDSRPALTGVLIRVRGNTVTFVACDSFRLVERTVLLVKPATQNIDLILPASAMSVLAKVLKDTTGDVQMQTTRNGGQVVFKAEGFELVSRILDAQYPAYERIIPATFRTRVEVETASLLREVELAALFTSSYVKLDVNNDGTIKITGPASERGGTDSGITAQHTDGSVVGGVAVNVAFLLEALKNIGTKKVRLEMQTPQAPLVFRPVGDKRMVSLILPVTVQD